jgi:hypothetical protein
MPEFLWGLCGELKHPQKDNIFDINKNSDDRIEFKTRMLILLFQIKCQQEIVFLMISKKHSANTSKRSSSRKFQLNQL